MQVEDLYYKKYLKYKNKYLELKQYGGVNELDRITSIINIKKGKGKEKEKYETLLTRIQQIEVDDDIKYPIRKFSLLYYINDRNIDNLNFDNSHTFSYIDLSLNDTKGFFFGKNYIAACESARNTFVTIDGAKGFKWKIVDNITNFVTNYDLNYYDRNDPFYKDIDKSKAYKYTQDLLKHLPEWLKIF